MIHIFLHCRLSHRRISRLQSQDTLIVVHGICKIDRCIVILRSICIVSFFESHDFLHQWMMEVVFQVGIVVISLPLFTWNFSCNT